MNILFDTSFLVQLDRKNAVAIELGKSLVGKDYNLWISTISVAEMMTGAYLSPLPELARKNVLSILNLFNWVNVTTNIAFRTAELSAFLISHKRRIEFQDVLIAATAMELNATYILTENKKDFMQLPAVRDRVFSIKEMKERMETAKA